jgi:hypothetical protein
MSSVVRVLQDISSNTEKPCGAVLVVEDEAHFLLLGLLFLIPDSLTIFAIILALLPFSLFFLLFGASNGLYESNGARRRRCLGPRKGWKLFLGLWLFLLFLNEDGASKDALAIGLNAIDAVSVGLAVVAG